MNTGTALPMLVKGGEVLRAVGIVAVPRAVGNIFRGELERLAEELGGASPGEALALMVARSEQTLAEELR